MSKFGGVLVEPEDAAPAGGSRFGGIPVDDNTASPFRVGDPEDEFALSAERIHMNQIEAVPRGFLRNQRLLEKAGLITQGQNRDDIIAILDRKGIESMADPETGDVLFDSSSFSGEPREFPLVKKGLKKAFDLSAIPGKSAWSAMEWVSHHTWDVQMSAAKAAAAKSRVRRQVEWTLENSPDAPLLSAGEYLSLRMDNAVPEAFVMTEPEIDKLGSTTFAADYGSPMVSMAEDVYGYAGDIWDTLAGEVAGLEGLNIHPDDVEQMVSEVGGAIMEPVESAMTRMVYEGEIGGVPPTPRLALFGPVWNAKQPGESDDGHAERMAAAADEAIRDGNKGAKEFISVPAMAVFDATTALDWPATTARRTGINFTMRGARHLDEAHEALAATVRTNMESEAAMVARAADDGLAALETEAQVVRAEAAAETNPFKAEQKQARLDELEQQQAWLVSQKDEASRLAAEAQDSVPMMVQANLNRRTLELVDVAFKRNVDLKGDSRTLLAWDEYLSAKTPDVDLPDTPEALADLRATFMPEAEEAFALALQKGNKRGWTLTGMDSFDHGIYSNDTPKRILAVTDAARMKAASWTARWIGETGLGRSRLGSRGSVLGVDIIQRTLMLMLDRPHAAQPLAGPTATSYWAAYSRGLLLHPAMFADVVDGLQRYNRSAVQVLEARRAYLQSLVSVVGDDAVDALRVLDDGDGARIVGAAEALKHMDELTRAGKDGESFTREFVAASEFVLALEKSRGDLPEIAALLGSDVLAERVEGQVRLRAKAEAAKAKASDAVASRVMAEMAELARAAGKDTKKLDKALSKNDLDRAFKEIDNIPGTLDSTEVWLVAEASAERARARVSKALEADGGAEGTLAHWDDYLAKTADADAAFQHVGDVRSHMVRLEEEWKAHNAYLRNIRATMRDPEALAEFARISVAEGDALAVSPENIKDTLDEMLTVAVAARNQAREAAQAAKKALKPAQENLNALQKQAAAMRPEGTTPEAFAKEYHAQLVREARTNVKEVNGLFERVRHMDEFNDLQPHERAKVLAVVTGKNPAPSKQPQHIRDAADNLRATLRRYARELHEHLTEQGVKGATVDDIVANLDLTRLLPNLKKWDGLSKQKALAGEVISPSYLSPGMVDIAPDRLNVRQRQAVNENLRLLWKGQGGEGSPPKAWAEETMRTRWREIAPYNHDPVPLISHFLKQADTALADRQFMGDLRARFPLGQRLARQYGWDGEVVAAAYGYKMVDRNPLVGAHDRVGVPEELKGVHDTIVMRLSSGETADAILRDYQRAFPELVTPKAVEYVKGAEKALETPLYLPAPVAEFIDWYYRDGNAMRKQLESMARGTDVARTLHAKGGGEAALEVFDGVHSWTKQQLTTYRSLSGYTATNIVGNVGSALQVDPVSFLDPTNHMISSLVVAGQTPDAVIDIAGRKMALREIELQALEDGALTTSQSQQFRSEQGLAQAVSSPARDRRLFDDSQLNVTGAGGEARPLVPPKKLFDDGEKPDGGFWNTFAVAAQESVAKEELLGLSEAIKTGMREKDFRKLLEGSLKAVWSGPAKTIASLATRASGAFAGSLIGTAAGAGPGLGGLVGAIGGPGWMRISSEMNGAVENQARMVVYVGALRQGATRQQAAERVGKAFRNYDELSPFERNWLRRGFGFYTWDAGNIRLQTKWAAANPGKYATLTTMVDLYHRGEFTEDDIRQLPQGSRHKILLNMGAGKIASFLDLPQTGVFESIERKIDLARVLTPGGVTDRERASALGQMNQPLQFGLSMVLGVDASRKRLEESAWIGNRAGWKPEDLDLTPPYLRDMLGFQVPEYPQMGEKRMMLKTSNPRAFAIMQGLPLSSVLAAYWRTMIPPADPAMYPEWEQDMEDRLLLTMMGANVYPVTDDADRIRQIRERDLARLLRELAPVAPWNDKFELPPSTFIKEHASQPE